MPFGGLGGLVVAQRGNQLRRQGDDMLAGTGLELGQDQAAVLSLRAGTRMSGAPVQAFRGVPGFGTGDRVRAAVPPAAPLQLPADGDGRGVQVHIGPAQTQCLALAQAEGQGHAPPGAIAQPRCLGCKGSRFGQGQRLDLGRAR
jgi:hypothetical protein